jgi:hypothetical protein
VPQKWRNCEGKIPDESKAHSLEQQQIAKPIFWEAARLQNLSLLGQRKISRTRDVGTFHLN